MKHIEQNYLAQKDISEACETSNFFKIKTPPCSKKISEALEQKLSSSKDISEADSLF